MPWFVVIPNGSDLQHHGIKGQKWGIRRYQNPDGSLTSAGRLRYGARNATRSGDIPVQILSGFEQKGIPELPPGYLNYDNYKLFVNSSKMERNILIGYMEQELKPKAANASTAAGIQWSIDYMKRRNEELDYRENVKSSSDLPKKSKTSGIKQDLKAINPKYGTSEAYLYNCMYCSVTYDLRRRGYDVKARGRTHGGNIQEYGVWYKGADKELRYYTGEDGRKQMVDYIKSQPDNARGIIGGTYKLGSGGHAFAYERLPGGKIRIMDPQSGELYSTFYLRNFKTFDIIRIDNLEPNWDQIGEAIDPKSLRKR